MKIEKVECICCGVWFETDDGGLESKERDNLMLCVSCYDNIDDLVQVSLFVTDSFLEKWPNSEVEIQKFFLNEEALDEEIAEFENAGMTIRVVRKEA